MTWRHRRVSCVAGVGLGDIYLRFRWQAWHFWHFWHWAGFSGTLVHTHLVHTQLVTTCPHNLSTHNLSTYICCTCRSFTISFLFPAFPIPSLPFFCQLLEAVDMWGYPVLYIFLKPGWMDACLLPLNMSGIKKSRKAKAETMYVPHSARSISQPPAC